VAGFTYGNGILHLRTFDADQRVTSIRDVQTLEYSYDAAGNVAGIAGGGNAAASQTFGYDALDRLTQASGIYGILEFTYDPNGNRLSRTRDGAVTNYTYTPQTNQLAAIATADMKQTFTNDKNGAIARIDSDNGDTVQFTHNGSGRLAAVSSSAGSIAQYTYNAFGRRLARVGAMTATTFFQYDVIGANLLEEAAGDGSARVDYIYLDSLPVAALNPATGELSYLHTDRLGTPQSATSAGQSVVWSAASGPFGELDTVPSLIVQNLRFPGQEFDAETGLHQNGFRDYAPQLGRYIQSDPIGLVAGVNTYAYATANPLRFTDPRGLQGIPIPYDASYYQAALASAIYCRRNPAACAAVEKQARQARADELNTVASFLEILGGLALLDPLTAPATPLLGYGALCLKTQAQLVNPDPTQVAGDLVTKAVTSGAGKPAQPILEFILQQFFSTRPAY
jgi:RHS repeat-associated protein